MAAAVCWVGGALIALRVLGFYPPAVTRTVLLLGWGPIAFAVWLLGINWRRAGRPGAAWASAALMSIMPMFLVTTVPGFEQRARSPIPGGASYVIAAAPQGQWNLYLVKDGDGSNPIRLTDTTWAERYPTLSPDGRSVVYSSFEAGSFDLHLMTVDSHGNANGDRTLTSDTGDETDARWSPDGTQIVYRTDDIGLSSLVLLTLATDERQVIAESGWNPTWSPDGSHIAYVAASPRHPGNTDIYVMRANGSDAHRLIDSGGGDFFPYWSRDGSAIAFTSDVNGNSDVYRADADGSHLIDLTPNSPALDATYGWTPDGHVVFLSDRSGTGETFVYFMNADGSSVRLASIL
jgi:Tol biopolymer transport system component